MSIAPHDTLEQGCSLACWACWALCPGHCAHHKCMRSTCNVVQYMLLLLLQTPRQHLKLRLPQSKRRHISWHAWAAGQQRLCLIRQLRRLLLHLLLIRSPLCCHLRRRSTGYALCLSVQYNCCTQVAMILELSSFHLLRSQGHPVCCLCPWQPGMHCSRNPLPAASEAFFRCNCVAQSCHDCLHTLHA